MPKSYSVYITRRIPKVGIQLLKKQKNFSVVVNPHNRVLSRKELLKNIKGVHAILSLLTDTIDAEVMDTAGATLQIIANYAVGFDNIDLEAAKKRNIHVTNTPGVLTNAVAEHTIALILGITKRIVEADTFTRAGKYTGWEPMLFLGTELHGKTLGIIGGGRIGSNVALFAHTGLGMRIVYADVVSNPEFEKTVGAKKRSLAQLLKSADIISIHVPLLPSTHHLIGKKELSIMKKTSYLINTSRGPVVDERALTAALRAKKIAGAALDVFEKEPELAPGLPKLPNVILTPHTASATIETRNAMAEIAAKNIIAVLHGKKPITPVTK